MTRTDTSLPPAAKGRQASKRESSKMAPVPTAPSSTWSCATLERPWVAAASSSFASDAVHEGGEGLAELCGGKEGGQGTSDGG